MVHVAFSNGAVMLPCTFFIYKCAVGRHIYLSAVKVEQGCCLKYQHQMIARAVGTVYEEIGSMPSVQTDGIYTEHIITLS